MKVFFDIIPSGAGGLNEVIGKGLQRSKLTILAGDLEMGKMVFLAYLLLNGMVYCGKRDEFL